MGLKGNSLILYSYIRTMCDTTSSKQCYASIDTMSSMTGISRRMIISIINDMCEKKFIVKEKARKNGHNCLVLKCENCTSVKCENNTPVKCENCINENNQNIDNDKYKENQKCEDCTFIECENCTIDSNEVKCENCTDKSAKNVKVKCENCTDKSAKIAPKNNILEKKENNKEKKVTYPLGSPITKKSFDNITDPNNGYGQFMMTFMDFYKDKFGRDYDMSGTFAYKDLTDFRSQFFTEMGKKEIDINNAILVKEQLLLFLNSAWDIDNGFIRKNWGARYFTNHFNEIFNQIYLENNGRTSTKNSGRAISKQLQNAIDEWNR